MRVSRLQSELKFSGEDVLCQKRIRRHKTTLFDGATGDSDELECRWRLVVGPRKPGRQDTSDQGSQGYLLDVRLHNLIYLPFISMAAFGSATFSSTNSTEKRLDLPEVRLREKEDSSSDGVLWRFREQVSQSEKSTRFSFRVNVTLVYDDPPRVLRDMEDLLRRGMCSDLTLFGTSDFKRYYGRHYYYAHKGILSARSGLFERWFDTFKVGDQMVLDNNPQALGILLEFLYTGDVVSDYKAKEVADQLYLMGAELPELKEKVLQELVTPENAPQLMTLAEEEGDEDLKRKCLECLEKAPESSDDELATTDSSEVEYSD